MNKKYEGTVATDKGRYGFIQCSELDRNIFYHCSACVPEEQIQHNDPVEFELSEDRKFGGLQAINVRKKETKDV